MLEKQNLAYRRGLLIVVAFSTAVFAIDASAQTAPPTQTANWNGLYLGAGIGGAFNSAKFSRPTTTLSDISIGGIENTPVFEFYGGYNWTTSSGLLFGAETQLTFLPSGNFSEFGPTIDSLQQIGSSASVSGRLGLLVGSNSLIYAKAGPALVELSGNEGFTGTFSTILPAAQIGFGVETMLTPQFGLRAEATYLQALNDLSLNEDTDRYRPNLLTFLVGAEYKFDAPAGSAASRPAVAAPSWTGFAVGGDVAINGDEMRYFDTNQGETGPLAYSALGAGAYLDANLKVAPSAVIGLEVSAALQHAAMQTAAGSSGFYGTFYTFGSIDNNFALSARAGWLVTPETLVYGRLGAAEMHVTTDYGYWNNFAPNPTGGRYMPAVLAGLGVETYVLPNVSVRFEGDYKQATNSIVYDGTVDPREFSLKPSNASASMGVAVHF